MRKQKSLDTSWHKTLASAFIDTEAAYGDYDSGNFLHAATGGGESRPSTFYGESLIPQGFVEREWTRCLTLCNFIGDRSFLAQALIIM